MAEPTKTKNPKSSHCLKANIESENSLDPVSPSTNTCSAFICHLSSQLTPRLIYLIRTRALQKFDTDTLVNMKTKKTSARKVHKVRVLISIL